MREQALTYLLHQLNGQGDFKAQWSRLTDQDKDTLKRWANEEQDALGL